MRAYLITAGILSVAVVARSEAQCSSTIQQLVTDQKFDEARAGAQALIAKNASDDAALHCMGRIYAAMDKSGDAAGWFEKAIKANDKVSVHHLWLGNALGDQAQHANKLKLPFLARRVKSEFEKAVELDPTSIDGRHGLIQFYSQAPGVMGGSLDKAKEQAREIEKLNPMRGHWEMAQLLESKDKDLAGAEREYTAAMNAAPDSTFGYNNLGAFYRRQKKYAEGIVVYERLLKARPDAIATHLNLGYNIALVGENLDRAEREIQQWLAAAPKDAPVVNRGFAHYVLGIIYERQSKKDAARAEYQSALAFNPKHTEAKKALDALK
jgi:tetratricopeptide (TPR) repeat protein